MGEFRIGRRYAQHVYPSTPRAPAPALLQIGSDLLTDAFAVVGGAPPAKVEKVAGTLLQVPLPGYRRVNGLWVQISALVDREDSGNLVYTIFPWVKFSTLPQYFAPTAPTLIVASVAMNATAAADQVFESATLTLTALFKLPAASSDGAPIALPAVDDLLVGVVATGTTDFNVGVTTIATAGEMSNAIITQAPTVEVATLP